ncbi:AsmA family protein [Roseovarius albus]|uniref:AsmA family protein n=1 Tax=Roseovarius albus TaxID=1247867 RepID=UPI001F40019C|nr:AsmA-like C-terminal region-containing protein [Roseovarius albus]
MSERLNQNVSIVGGVDLSIDERLFVVAKDLIVSTDTTASADLVKVDKLGFALDWRAMLSKEVRLSDVHADGAKIEMRSGGHDSTAPPETDSADQDAKGFEFSSLSETLQEVITDRQIKLSDFELIYQNADNGLDFDLQLSTAVAAQKEVGAPWTLTAKGNLNEQDLSLEGTFQANQPFSITATSDQIDLQIDGAPAPDGYGSGFTAKISTEVRELAELLDILKLQKTISGKGTANATFNSLNGKQSLGGLDLKVSLDSGESVTLTGDLGELRDLNDATLEVDISLYPSDQMPSPAKLRRDLKLTGFEMDLTAQPDGIPLRKMKVQTNGFVLNTHGKGAPPITVSQIKITSDGLLDLGKVGLRIGPPGSYFVVFDGSIGDAFQVKDIEFDATIDLPTVILLKPGQFQNSEMLGKVVGGFHLSGDSKTLALSNFTAKSQGTDVLQLDVTAASGNLLKLSDNTFDVTADVPSGAKLLSALKLPPVSTGKIKFGTKLSNDGTKWQSQTQLSVAKSDLNMSLTAKLDQSPPHMGGQITSSLVRLIDVKHITAMIRELSPSDGGKKKPDSIFSNVTLEPVTTQMLQSGLDMDVAIDLKKIEGVVGTSAVKTEFILKIDKAQLGPVKFEYDGGHFDVTGSVDLKNHPDIVKVKGNAGGWNFGTILKELHIKKRGSGILNATFNLSGAHKSIKGFTDTASGNILVSMRNGKIHTRLINLAGLGVFPWLFTDAHGKVAPIACLRAPLRFDRGNITIREAALETDKVQVVVNGDVNLGKETIDVTGEPRPIGKPLSRSPWPFVVSGSLKHPKLGLKKGSHRQRRSDGKTTPPEHRKHCIPDILQLH